MRTDKEWVKAVYLLYVQATDDDGVVYSRNRIINDVAQEIVGARNEQPYYETSHGEYYPYPTQQDIELVADALYYLETVGLVRIDHIAHRWPLVFGAMVPNVGAPGMDRVSLFYITYGDAPEFVRYSDRWQEFEDTES